MADKEKKLIEQIADTVNDLVEGIAITASERFGLPMSRLAAKRGAAISATLEFPAPASTATPRARCDKERGAKKTRSA